MLTPLAPCQLQRRRFMSVATIYREVFVLAVLKAKIKIINPRIRAGIGLKPTMSLGKWQSGPSPGTRNRPLGDRDEVPEPSRTIPESAKKDLQKWEDPWQEP